MLTEQQFAPSTEPASAPQEPGSCGPLFLVGVWRSGTSLLYALLNQHPQVALMYEGDLPLLWPLFLGRSARSAMERWDFWNEALKRHKLDDRNLPSNGTGFHSTVDTAYREYARAKGAAVWGCKSPSYYDSLQFLARHFPTARFLIIWRDPRDICRSIIRASETSSFFRKKGMMTRALLGCRKLHQECQRLIRAGVSVHQVRYENLVRNPVPVLREICEFIGVPFDPKIANLAGADRSAVYDGKHHSLLNVGRVVGSRKRTAHLPDRLQRKIDRYSNFWKQSAAWPLGRYAHHEAAGTPGILERICDRVWFDGLRMFDRGTRLAYCLAPLWLWKAYRALKERLGPPRDIFEQT